MRISLEFISKTPLRLPLQYNHLLAGVWYSYLNTPYRTVLHDQGLRRVKGKPVKLFTFSRLEGPYVMDRKSKTITFHGPVRWTVASALDELIYDFSMSLLKAKHVLLGGMEVQVGAVRLETYTGTTTQSQIRLLSPITVYRTVKQPDGRKFTHYYRPGTPEFTSLLRKNLILKATALGMDITDDDAQFEMIPVDENSLKERIILYQDTPVHGWDGDFRLRGTRKMLELAWNAGVGMKNSGGFGMIDIFSRGR
ncbi:CRISPR-associated endoribonuclease Cas6 [Alicyclobacillus shizuokensis]|uniref:CRISPR-associated endoribonuclease Cas6 n=1 Tax=Alicyclobacillus shizuokensis TaxID=392014 RepID=UPI000829C597|nr:CRISPR-associated endoribonuclease Cas6 [Alicyclobacillus shizuokensis]